MAAVNGDGVNYTECQYTKTLSKRCENENFHNKYCSYHQRVIEELIEPQDQVILMRDLPSMRLDN